MPCQAKALLVKNENNRTTTGSGLDLIRPIRCPHNVCDSCKWCVSSEWTHQMDLHRNFVFSLALGVSEKLQHGTQWHRSLNLFSKKELSAQGQGEFSICFFSCFGLASSWYHTIVAWWQAVWLKTIAFFPRCYFMRPARPSLLLEGDWVGSSFYTFKVISS